MDQVTLEKEKTAKETFPVTGMTCASCAASVESMLQNTEGVKAAGVNYADQTAWVDYDPDETIPKDLKKVIQSIGYDLIIDSGDPAEELEAIKEQQYESTKRKLIWSAILTLPVVIFGMGFMEWVPGQWISMGLSAVVVFYFGRNFFSNALKQARHGKANMDTLVALSTGIAFLFSVFNTVFPEFWYSRDIIPHVYYEAAVVIISFILLGRLLEERAKSKTSSALKKLMGLQPKTVTIISSEGEKEVLVSSLEVGDIILVKPGDKIPVDGKVVDGSSFVDESMITGEPVAVEKIKDSEVFAGTVNQKGSFSFKAGKVGGDTLLAGIIKTVREAQGSKAPVQKLVDKIAGIFVPVVIGISIVTFIAWMLLGGDNAFTYALLSSITVLVIACPCALGLATPTAIMVGVGKGAENNILIKNAESLELGHKVNAIVLDKTGTITKGQPAVTDIVWIDKEKAEVLFSLESLSEHPLADAVVKRLKNNERVEITSFESITGRGVRGSIDNTTYLVGNRQLMIENNIDVSVRSEDVSKWSEEAKTVIYFSDDQKLLAILAIADEIKPTSKEAISLLNKRGVEVYMVTGDNEHTAKAVGKAMGISHVEAEVMPEDKYEFVKKLQSEGKIVAMVGDGINDSQALAQANVSIAMGKGSDIAMDVASMTLITSDLKTIPKALNLSTKTVRGVKQNLFWAFIYNVIGIPIAAGLLYPINGFLLDPMIAGAAMAFSSVSVVLNSLRLRNIKL